MINNVVSLSKAQGTLPGVAVTPGILGFLFFIRLLVFYCECLCPFVKGQVAQFSFPFFLWDKLDTSFPSFN